MTARPLDGITVVSIEQAVAAPYATRQLADLGARVIKIERDTGDFARGYDESVRGMASYFVWLNRGKESVVLDLKEPRDAEALRGLLGGADVFVQNLAPGAADRLGLDATTLRAANPRLIHVSISGYGTGGDYDQKKAYDLLIQCEAGLLSVTGSADEPAKVGVSIADIAAGTHAHSAILTALFARERTGEGDVIEVSMLEALGEWMSQPYLYAQYSGAQPPRTGAEHATIAPYGPFHTADGSVFIGIQNEREWAAFAASVLDQPEVAEDPRFASNTLRVRHRAVLRERIESAFAQRSSADVLQRLDAAGIANAALRDLADFSAHPQLAARDRWREIDTPVGPVRVLAPPATFGSFEPLLGPVPALGEHTERVLGEVQ